LGISYNDHQTKDRKFRKECKQKWISNVYEQIQREGIDLRDEFLFYASGMFYKALKPKLVNCSKKINCRTGKQYNDTKK
jgi:hypothetical protein